MSYRRALLTRWSRRDRLTVLVVAVTTAFLVGTTLLLAAAGAQTATLAGDLNTTATATYEDSFSAATADADPGDLVFPTAVLRAADGSSHRFIGVPNGTPTEIADSSVDWRRATIPSPGGGVTGPVASSTQRRFRTASGSTTLTIDPQTDSDSLFPAAWYVANASTVRSLGGGDVDALVIHPDERLTGLLSVPTVGSPLVAALVFLFAGMRQLLTALLAATVGSALLVLVVVYNVLRMTVRDRIRAIRVIRSTGGTPRRVRWLFGLRAGLIVGLGVALGYAVGFVLTNAVVNVAVFAGLPISLTPSLTPLALGTLAVVLPTLVLAGVLAGVLAARTATRRPPTRLGDTPRRAGTRDGSTFGRLRSRLTPTLLDPRAVVPTTLTLAVFAVVVVLIVSLTGAVAPLSTQDEGTIAEAGSANVLNSRIDADYATVLRSRGVDASPEIILAQAVDGEPFLGLGANYTAFASVTNASLERGHAPRTPSQAVIGADLARTLDVGVGDPLTLGGSFSPAVTRVTVVGVFSAAGVDDDQVVVPLPMAHHLAIREGFVQYIRTSGADLDGMDGTAARANDTITTTIASAPNVTAANRTVSVTVRAENPGDAAATREVPVSIGNVTRTRSVSLGAGESTQFSVSLRAPAPGERTLRVGSRSQPIRVLAANALWFPTELPGTGPPNATLFVPVVTPDEEPIPNATVAVGGRTTNTGSNGIAQVTLPAEPGSYVLRASKAGRPRATHNLTVATGSRREPSARLQVTPRSGSVLERPTANVTVANPWNARLSRELTLSSAITNRNRTVTLDPGEVASLNVSVFAGADGRASPGTYPVRLLSNGTPIAQAEYTVEGDQRLFSALASNGQYSGNAGIGQAIQSVFGNVQLLFVVMVLLAGLTTVGTTAATFAQTVHARRRAIGVHRATGATPRDVLRTVLADVCLISVPAAIVALCLAVGSLRVLGQAGVLTLFGIRLSVATPAWVLLGTAVGAFALSVLGAVLATVPFLTRPPTGLLGETTAEPTHRDQERR
ncbi:FtsX-like permease family protein [Halococcus hamelinensis]|uniref:Permease n=3 Tax=Halococcus hamelinensis TaxID=332168 RepID=M0M187_9EURY|nr:FtsX-like permease family protein [Halococcus hamelinensis]EMA38379.1 permease [Halococcus hamelinensis 100A6]